MQFNQEIGKQFHKVAIGVNKNTGQGVNHMADRYNGSLRNKPVSPEQSMLKRQNDILRDKLKELQKQR